MEKCILLHKSILNNVKQSTEIQRDILGQLVKWKTVPVGKITPLRMYPTSFREFLRAAAPKTFAFIDSLDNIGHLPETILNRLNSEWRTVQHSVSSCMLAYKAA